MQTPPTVSDFASILRQLAKAIRTHSPRRGLEAVGALLVGIALAGARFVSRLIVLFFATLVALVLAGLPRRWTSRLAEIARTISR